MSNPDRQSILQAIIEGALRAAADPAVTAVLRSWDYYDPGTSVQPLMPLLIVSVTSDRDLGIDLGLYTASAQISLICDWSPGIRDMYDRIRSSVRSAMHALTGASVSGLMIDGIQEISCTEPEMIDPDGDTVFGQTLSYNLWFEAPVTEDAIIDQEIYLVARDPETGCLYTTVQADDPRRITRWACAGAEPGTAAVEGLPSVRVSYAYGAWADRASLNYSDPVTPLSTSIPQISTP